MKAAAQTALDRAKSMDNLLRGEVYGGEWNDEVGNSYLAYTANICRMIEKAVVAADKLESIERALETFDENADAERVEKIKAAVNKK